MSAKKLNKLHNKILSIIKIKDITQREIELINLIYEIALKKIIKS